MTQHSSDGFNLYRFQQRAFPALLGWALGSVAAGLFWMKNLDGSVAGFGSQFAGWGAINAILGLFGLNSARRNLERQAKGDISLAEHTQQGRNFERLVLLNAGLDIGYIAAGALLAGTPVTKPQNRPGFRSGMGWGILVQGAFLLVWDLLLALLVHRRQRA
jgi:Family of unknown function (DUF6992)